MSEENRMPKVDFVKDKLHPYMVDQIKIVEKDNIKRFKEFKRKLFSGRVGGCILGTVVFSIYFYTMNAVKRETFLDNFDDPALEDD